MFSTFKRDAGIWIREIRENPIKMLLAPCTLLFFALLFRIFSGGTSNLYNVLICKGFFPGAFWYMLGHILRIFFAGLMLTGILFCRGLFELRLKAFACTALIGIVLLMEYRIIFISVSPILALLLCAASLAAAVLCMLLFLKTCCPGAFPSLLFFFFQFIFFIQLISLCAAL
jgi:hypothetical protein